MKRLTLTITADFSPDDEYWAEDLQGMKEDCEDVVRGFGGSGIVVETEEENL